MTYNEIIECLHDLADPEVVLLKEKRFGIVAQNSLGIYHKELKLIAKEIGHEPGLALQLFDSGIYEARLLCSKLLRPKNVTEDLAEKWIKVFDNWEICDSFCMGLVAKSKYAYTKIMEWSERTPEFEKRAAFATMAAFCMADKKADNEVFEQFFPIILREANDDRHFVKKAVNWALRSIGKRNIDLRRQAIEVAGDLLEFENRAAKWIAKDALAELQKEGVRMSDYPRGVYRPVRRQIDD